MKYKKLRVRSSVRKKIIINIFDQRVIAAGDKKTVRIVGSFVQTSTKNAVEFRSRNLITLVWTFYHSLSDYA